jgi:hypothetical protein
MYKSVVKVENSTLCDVSIPYISLGVSIAFELHIVVSVSQVFIEASQQSVFQYEMSALFRLS